MKKQFLYNTILAGILGFSIQNAYAAAAGPSVDTAPMEQQCRFSGLRAAVYEYHPEFNSATTYRQTPEEKAANFTELALQLLDLHQVILPRSLELISQYKDYVSLSFEQQVAVFRKIESRFAGADAASWNLSLYLIAWIKGMDDAAMTSAERDVLSTAKQGLGNLARRAESAAVGVDSFYRLYVISAAGGNEDSVARLGELLDPASALSVSQKASMGHAEIHVCFAGRASSKGDTSKALEHLQMARQGETQDYIVLSQSKILAALMEKMPDATVSLVDELYKTVYRGTRPILLINLYKEYKKVEVAPDTEDEVIKDRLLGNIRFKLRGDLVDGADDQALDTMAEELKSLGDEEFAADLYASRYMRTSRPPAYGDDYNAHARNNIIGKLAATGEIGAILAPILQVIHEYKGGEYQSQGDYYNASSTYRVLQNAVQNNNLIALYGSQWVPSSGMYVYLSTYIPNQTVKDALDEIKADPKQLAFWKTEVNRVLMYCGGDTPSWLKALETELDSVPVPSAASAASGEGGAAAGAGAEASGGGAGAAAV